MTVDDCVAGAAKMFKPIVSTRNASNIYSLVVSVCVCALCLRLHIMNIYFIRYFDIDDTE